MGKTFNKYWPLARAAFLNGAPHRFAHGKEVVAVDGACWNGVGFRMLREALDFGVRR